MKFIDKIEEKIEVLFTFLNKDAETRKEGFLQAVVALGLFAGLFAAIGLAGTFIGV